MSANTRSASARLPKPFDLPAYLESRTAFINRGLDRFLPEETMKPATIHRAMRYSHFAGG